MTPCGISTDDTSAVLGRTGLRTAQLRDEKGRICEAVCPQRYPSTVLFCSHHVGVAPIHAPVHIPEAKKLHTNCTARTSPAISLRNMYETPLSYSVQLTVHTILQQSTKRFGTACHGTKPSALPKQNSTHLIEHKQRSHPLSLGLPKHCVRLGTDALRTNTRSEAGNTGVRRCVPGKDSARESQQQTNP